MVNDNVKQLAKSMRNSRTQSGLSLRRYSEINSLIERKRAFLSCNTDFNMEFRVYIKGNRVLLDLYLEPDFMVNSLVNS